MLTELLTDVHIPFFHEIALFFNEPYGLILATTVLIFCVTFYYKQQRNVLPLLLLTFFVSILFAYGAKMIYDEPRVCMGDKVECPESNAFPSLHSVFGFALMIPALGTPAFWIYLLYAVLIAFSRIYLGVHSLLDVAGAFAVCLIAFNLSKLVLIKLRVISNAPRI